MLKRDFIFVGLVVTAFLIGIAAAENQIEFLTDANLTDNETEILNDTNLTETKDIYLVNFFPAEAEIGDVQFNLQVRNDGNKTINNVIAFISGSGYSSYDIIPIDSLAPGERSYIFVYGNLKESGNLTLTLRIDREIFYRNILVTDPDEQILNDAEKEQAELENISQQVEELKSKYASLELEISEKKENDYDVSNINLDDLKQYLRNAEASIFDKDLNGANSDLRLAMEEYEYQKNKIDTAKLIPTLAKVKEYALIISAIFGSILAFFAIYELLIRKSLILAKFGKNIVVKVAKKGNGKNPR